MNAVATTNPSITTQAVRMLANFGRNYFVPLMGELENNVDALYERLKADNAGLSKHTVHSLFSGTEKLVRGYEIVDVPNHHVAAAPAKRADNVTDKIRAWAGYQPAGPIVAVRRGTKIAKGLEALKDGCSMEQLKEALGHADESTEAFLAYRPKKRGYGIRFDTETKEYFLIMPEGVTEIAYKDKGAADDQPQA